MPQQPWAALRKGSFQSPIMQAAAVQLNDLCADLGVDPVLLHSPGTQLIAEGVDGDSRSTASELLGPAANDKLWAVASAVALQAGWVMTVDAFA